jgi:hypothetical protein
VKAEDKLRVYWNRKEQDMGVHWPGGVSTKCDARYILCMVLNEEVIAELERRGYDPTTLKFEISPKKGNTRFTSQRTPCPPGSE